MIFQESYHQKYENSSFKDMIKYIIEFQIEASTRTNIDETRHPDLDQVHDSAHVVSVSPPPIHKHPHLRQSRSHSREARPEDRDVFAWRKVNYLKLESKKQ